MLAKDILKLLKDNPNAEICILSHGKAKPAQRVDVWEVNSVKEKGYYNFFLPHGPTKDIIVFE